MNTNQLTHQILTDMQILLHSLLSSMMSKIDKAYKNTQTNYDKFCTSFEDDVICFVYVFSF